MPFWRPTSWKTLQPLSHFKYKDLIYLKLWLCKQDVNLIDNSSCKAADNVANEEEAGDPGAEEEVDLDRVVGRRPVHHLGDRHAGEGEPATNNGGTEGDTYCSQHLGPTSDFWGNYGGLAAPVAKSVVCGQLSLPLSHSQPRPLLWEALNYDQLVSHVRLWRQVRRQLNGGRGWDRCKLDLGRSEAQ